MEELSNKNHHPYDKELSFQKTFENSRHPSDHEISLYIE
jgi:hypothetical protein